VLGSEAEMHERQDRVTVVRALEHLHPNFETHHELTVEIPLGLASFEVRCRMHLPGNAGKWTYRRQSI